MAKSTDYSMKTLVTKDATALRDLLVKLNAEIGQFRSSVSGAKAHEIMNVRRAIARINTILGTTRQDN